MGTRVHTSSKGQAKGVPRARVLTAAISFPIRITCLASILTPQPGKQVSPARARTVERGRLNFRHDPYHGKGPAVWTEGCSPDRFSTRDSGKRSVASEAGMAKNEEAFEVNGTVMQALANTRFRVQLETGGEVMAHVAGRP